MKKSHKRMVADLVKWLSEDTGNDPEACARALDTFTPEQVLMIIKFQNMNTSSLHVIISYARRFKQASAELTVDDVIAARDMLAVKEVMES